MTVYRFDGKGNVEEVAADQADATPTGKAFLAITGNSGTPEFRMWLKQHLGDPHADTMTAPDAHARCTVFDDRATLVLRVARREADPDDIRRQPLIVWLEKGRIIIASRAHLPELFGLEQWKVSHHAPLSIADFVARMGLRAADRLEPIVEHIGDVLDELEEVIIEDKTPELSKKLSRVRRTIIALRRMIWPQRDVLNTLEIEDLSYFSDWDKARLREATARTTRLRRAASPTRPPPRCSSACAGIPTPTSSPGSSRTPTTTGSTRSRSCGRERQRTACRARSGAST